MFRRHLKSTGPSWSARLLWAAATVTGLALGGCAHFDDLRGEKYPEDEMSSTCRKLRNSQGTEEPWGLSNKAVQIRRDLGD